MKATNYWENRSKTYSNLIWVKNKNLLNKLIDFCNLEKTDRILDAGCGLGAVSNKIIDNVEEVIAVDNSHKMLGRGKFKKDIKVMYHDLEQKNDIFKNYFNKIIARMVFHHVFDLEKAFANCYNMLSNNGWLILYEGIAPSTDKRVIEWTNNIRLLKEKRNNFTQHNLISLFKNTNFINIETKIILDKYFSVTNWLKNAVVDKSIADKMFKLHIQAPDYIKKAYKMKIIKQDIILQCKTLLIKGQRS